MGEGTHKNKEVAQMKHTLVGYTGFVGQNLKATHEFDGLYNSSNIEQSFGADNGLVLYSGMYSEKFLANADPSADLKCAETAMENIRKMKPEQLVLISTVDVYSRPVHVNENTAPGGEGETPYGANRLALEHWVREEYPEALIVRLPGLFGKGMKKNFIFDLFTIIPMMLREEKYTELCQKEALVKESYCLDDKGFYRLVAQGEQKNRLKTFFAQNDFNALSFTDSRSIYQFYNLNNLWQDIERCLKMKIHLINMATEPVEAGVLYQMLFGREFVNHLSQKPVCYDMRTVYGREFGGLDYYVADSVEVISGIGKLVRQELEKEGGECFW